MSSYTSLSDHCNSISISRSAIHSEPSQLHSFFCVRTSEQDVWCWWLAGLTSGNWVIKAQWLSDLWNYTYVFFIRFERFFKIQKHDFLRFLRCCTRFLEHCLQDTGRPLPGSAKFGALHYNYGRVNTFCKFKFKNITSTLRPLTLSHLYSVKRLSAKLQARSLPENGRCKVVRMSRCQSAKTQKEEAVGGWCACCCCWRCN